MADFQYTPKVVNDPIINVAQALRTMDSTTYFINLNLRRSPVSDPEFF